MYAKIANLFFVLKIYQPRKMQKSDIKCKRKTARTIILSGTNFFLVILTYDGSSKQCLIYINVYECFKYDIDYNKYLSQHDIMHVQSKYCGEMDCCTTHKISSFYSI